MKKTKFVLPLLFAILLSGCNFKEWGTYSVGEPKFYNKTTITFCDGVTGKKERTIKLDKKVVVDWSEYSPDNYYEGRKFVGWSLDRNHYKAITPYYNEGGDFKVYSCFTDYTFLNQTNPFVLGLYPTNLVKEQQITKDLGVKIPIKKGVFTYYGGRYYQEDRKIYYLETANWSPHGTELYSVKYYTRTMPLDFCDKDTYKNVYQAQNVKISDYPTQEPKETLKNTPLIDMFDDRELSYVFSYDVNGDYYYSYNDLITDKYVHRTDYFVKDLGLCPGMEYLPVWTSHGIYRISTGEFIESSKITDEQAYVFPTIGYSYKEEKEKVEYVLHFETPGADPQYKIEDMHFYLDPESSKTQYIYLPVPEYGGLFVTNYPEGYEEGTIFDYWESSDGGKFYKHNAFVVKQSETLTAHWKYGTRPCLQEIHYELFGKGTLAEGTPLFARHGEQVFIPDAIGNEGYEFFCWYFNPDFSNPIPYVWDYNLHISKKGIPSVGYNMTLYAYFDKIS